MIEFEDALAFLNNLLVDRTGGRLSGVELEVLKAAWNDYTYEQAAEISQEYAPSYLQNRAAPELWNRLSALIGRGEKVTKKRFRSFIEREIQSSASFTQSKKQKERQGDSFIRGGSPPRITELYGYDDEIEELRLGIQSKHCVLLLGPPGVGKSSLSAKLVEQIAHDSQTGFEAVIWRSLHHRPMLDDLVQDFIKLMGPLDQSTVDELESSSAKISFLLDNLKSRRFLLVLDDAGSIVKGGRMASYRENYREYGTFFRRIIEEQHSSCLLLLTSVPYIDLSTMIGLGASAQQIKLKGLSEERAKQMLSTMDLKVKDDRDWKELIQLYSGNPFMLKAIGSHIQEYFGGSVKTYLECQTVFLGDAFKSTLNQILAPEYLAGPEREILKYLADQMNQGVHLVPFSTLLAEMPSSTSEVIESVESLTSRSLIEKTKDTQGELLMGIVPVIGQYIAKDPGGFFKTQVHVGK